MLLVAAAHARNAPHRAAAHMASGKLNTHISEIGKPNTPTSISTGIWSPSCFRRLQRAMFHAWDCCTSAPTSALCPLAGKQKAGPPPCVHCSHLDALPSGQKKGDGYACDSCHLHVVVGEHELVEQALGEVGILEAGRKVHGGGERGAEEEVRGGSARRQVNTRGRLPQGPEGRSHSWFFNRHGVIRGSGTKGSDLHPGGLSSSG